MSSACGLTVLNVCVKSHENMSSGFKVMEPTRKLLTHKGNKSKRRKTRVTVYVFCTLSHGVQYLCEVS